MFSQLRLVFVLAMRPLFVVLMLSGLAACDSPLSLLTGGGPNVNAPIAAGQTVEQTQGISLKNERAAPSVSLRPKSRVGEVDQSVTNNVNIEPWLLLVIICLAAGGTIGWVDNIVRLIKR